MRSDPSGVKAGANAARVAPLLERDSSAQVNDRRSARLLDLTAGGSRRAREAPGPADDRVGEVESKRLAVADSLSRRASRVARRLEIRKRLMQHDRAAVGEGQCPHGTVLSAGPEGEHVLRLPQPSDFAAATRRAGCAVEGRVDRQPWCAPLRRLRLQVRRRKRQRGVRKAFSPQIISSPSLRLATCEARRGDFDPTGSLFQVARVFLKRGLTWGQVLGTGSRFFGEAQGASTKGCGGQKNSPFCRESALESAVRWPCSRSPNPPW